MIPKTGWRDMKDAPRDGTIIFTVSHQYNTKSQPRQIQSSQWLCDGSGKEWNWYKPWSHGYKTYADGWMHVDEFYKAMAELEPEDVTIPRSPDFIDDETPAGMSALNEGVEYDL